MAQSRFIVCGGCGFEVEAWSDGNPYYRDERGHKRYAYHPDHALGTMNRTFVWHVVPR
jgi:hypothetical protein